jgi:tripartite-type tricarboxylate transporter receptor subunit TctC
MTAKTACIARQDFTPLCRQLKRSALLKEWIGLTAGQAVLTVYRRTVAHWFVCIASATAIATVAPCRVALPAETDFYQGKQIRLIISSAPGGVYDTYGRLIARFMPAHLPGRPAVIAQNIPGASGLKATNYLYNKAPRDGTVIAGVHNGIPTAPLEEPRQAHFKVNKLSWIGSISEDSFVGYVWHTSPAQTYEDAKKFEVVVGSASINSMGAKMAIVSNAFFGTKFKLVIGYEDASRVKLALERGELQGTFANSWGDLKTQQPDWIRDKKVTIIIQHGYRKEPDLPDVPQIVDQIKNDDDRQALDLLLERQRFARPYLAPPDIPPERLGALRRAFDATMKDPDFVKAVKAARLTVDNSMTGEQLTKEIERLSATPAAVMERLSRLFDDYTARK